MPPSREMSASGEVRESSESRHGGTRARVVGEPGLAEPGTTGRCAPQRQPSQRDWSRPVGLARRRCRRPVRACAPPVARIVGDRDVVGGWRLAVGGWRLAGRPAGLGGCRSLPNRARLNSAAGVHSDRRRHAWSGAAAATAERFSEAPAQDTMHGTADEPVHPFSSPWGNPSRQSGERRASPAARPPPQPPPSVHRPAIHAAAVRCKRLFCAHHDRFELLHSWRTRQPWAALHCFVGSPACRPTSRSVAAAAGSPRIATLGRHGLAMA